MPGKKRPRRERTHDWQQIQQYTLWPEQKVYELLRPVVLFQEDAAERARETGAAERTLQRKANQFQQHGMISLFPKGRDAQPSSLRHALHPPFGSTWIYQVPGLEAVRRARAGTPANNRVGL